MTNPNHAGLRRRLRHLTAASAVDEALALVRSDPGWLAHAGWPSLLCAVAVAGAVSAHRESLGAGDVDPTLGWRTALWAVLAVGAWMARGAGHALVARRLAVALGQGLRPARLGAAALGQALSTAVTLLGLPLVVPGVLFAGRLSVLPGLIGAEGLRLGHAVRNAFRSSRTAAWTAGAAASLLGLLWLVTALNLALGALGLVGLLRLLTGIDTSGLARLLDPTDPGFLLAVGLTAFLLVDPVWALVRAVLYVERVDGPSGAGLERRWGALLAESAAALMLILLVAAPGTAAAEDGPQSLADWARAAQRGARDLHDVADGWDGAETVLVGPLGTVLREQLGGRVALEGGQTLPIDPGPLLDRLPGVARSLEDLDRVRLVARELEAAAARGRGLLTTTTVGATPDALLADELAAGRYRLDSGPTGIRTGPAESLRARLQRWWDALWSTEDPPQIAVPAAGAPPTASSRSLVALVAALAVLLVVAVLASAVRSLASLAPSRGSLAEEAGRLDRAGLAAMEGDRWEAEAERLAGQSQFGPAIRALYLGVLTRLDAAGTLQARPERTNGELLDGFRGAPAARRFFAASVVAFERSEFGGAAAGPEDWLTMRREAGPLLSGARFEGDT